MNALATARAAVESVAASLDRLRAVVPDAFEQEPVRSHFGAVEAELHRARERLNRPVFSIAVIGTTKAGKSTLLNTMIGRHLAPIDDDEKTAGVLVVRHGARTQLTIDPGGHSDMPKGTWVDVSDKDIYERCNQTMDFHRRKRDGADGSETIIVAPTLSVEAPILPGTDPALLALPSDTTIEFIDLPGLKSVLDKDNLTIIKNRLLGSFRIVVLDYMQTDNHTRRLLLQEIKDLVDLYGGKEHMLFVLNRVDMRNPRANLKERVENLQSEVKSFLGLSETPQIIPLACLVMYYPQLMWGPARHDGDAGPLTDLPRRKELLEEFLEHCANEIVRQSKNIDRFAAWKSTHEAILNTGDLADDASLLRQLCEWTYDWSNMDTLWKTLNNLIAKKYYPLVVMPAVSPLLRELSELAEDLEAIVDARETKTKRDIEAKREHHRLKMTKLDDLVANRQEELRRILKNAIVQLSDSTTYEDAEKSLKQLGEGFRTIDRIQKKIQDDASDRLIAPIVSGFKEGTLATDIQSSLENALSVPLLKALCRSYEQMRVVGYDQRAAKHGLSQTVTLPDDSGERRLHALEGARGDICVRMRDAMTSRSEFLLQRELEGLEAAINDMFAKEWAKLDDQIRGMEVHNAKASPGEVTSKLRFNPVKLPADIIDLRGGGGLNTGTTTIQATEYKKGLLRDKPKTVSKSAKTITLTLRDADAEFAAEWGASFAHARSRFQGNLSGWLLKALEDMLERYQDSAQQRHRSVMMALDEQLAALERGAEDEFARWAAARQGLRALAASAGHLHAAGQGS